MEDCKINLYKIKLDVLNLNDVYINDKIIKEIKIKNPGKEEREIYKEIYKIIKKEEAIKGKYDKLISYKNKNNNNWYKESFFNLDVEEQKKVLFDYIKKLYNFEEIINKKIKEVIKEEEVDFRNSKYLISPKMFIKIEEIDNTFYFLFEIKRGLISKDTLDKLIDKKNVYNNSFYIGREVKPITSNTRSLGIIKDIIIPTDKNYNKKLIELQQYKDITDVQKAQKNNVPLVIVNFKNNSIDYTYLSNELKLIIKSEDVDRNLIIKNKDRKKYVEEIIKKCNFHFLDKEPITKKCKKYKTIYLNGKNKIDKKYKLMEKKEIIDLKKSTSKTVFTIEPKQIPDIIKNSQNKIINVIILKDKNVKNEETHGIISKLYEALKGITEVQFKNITTLNDYNVDFSNVDNIINKAKEIYENKKYESNIPPLVITIGKRKESDGYYEAMKRRLFSLNFISQNILVGNEKHKYGDIEKQVRYKINNLILQVLSKYGMYPYDIDISNINEYDYILGVDVGNNKYQKRTIAGGIAVVNKQGILEKILPIKTQTNGEVIEFKYLFEKLKDFIDIKNKKILLLRDGKLNKKEINEINTEFNNFNVNKLTILNIVKRNNFRIYDDEGKKSIILKDNLALLTAHKKNGARPLKIDVKKTISKQNNKLIDEKIEEKDLELLYYLTYLNYSNLYTENLRLPAPVHYADKFVKALGKEWEVDNELLKNGFLYFI